MGRRVRPTYIRRLTDKYRCPNASVQFPFTSPAAPPTLSNALSSPKCFVLDHLPPPLAAPPPRLCPHCRHSKGYRHCSRSTCLHAAAARPLHSRRLAGRCSTEVFFLFLNNVFRLFRVVFNIFRFSTGVFSI
jgi:hypothetical protein